MGDPTRTWYGPSFEFATAGRVVFGGGRAAELEAIAAAFGSRALVCTGSRPDRHGSLLSALRPAVVFEVSGDPTIATAREAVAAARRHMADVVVGIGSGSVLDLGKSVAMLLGNEGDPLDCIEIIGRGEPITKSSLPFVAVPTTAEQAQRSPRTRSSPPPSTGARPASVARRCCLGRRWWTRCSRRRVPQK